MNATVAPRSQSDEVQRVVWEFEVIAAELGFVEGPIITTGGVTVVSLDRGHVYEIDRDGTSVLASLGGSPNGAAVDQAGTIFIAQNGGHWPGAVRRSQPGGVQAIHADGRASWVSLDPVFPTDLCIGPDGWIYVTDSTRNQRYDDGRIWRCDPLTGASELLFSVPWFPNGIAFGPDDRIYIASTGDRRVYVCDWDLGTVGPPQVFCELPEGRPDGLAFDAAGTLLVAAVGSEGGPGFVALVTPQGMLAGIAEVGPSTHYTNLALDPDECRLILTDATRGVVMATRDHANLALPLYPFRDAGSA